MLAAFIVLHQHLMNILAIGSCCKDGGITAVKDSDMRAFGIGHWNWLVAARTSRCSSGELGLEKRR